LKRVKPGVVGMLCLVGLPLVAGCSRADEQFVLPWFKIRLAEPSKTPEYFVRRYGLFWRQLEDADLSGATPIGSRAVAYFSAGEARVIHQGETEAIFICGRGPAGVSFPTGAEAVDCVDAIAGPTPTVATAVRFRRLSTSAAVIIEKTITVEDPGRVFLQPMVTFYDDAGTAYFVTMRAGLTATPDCALVAALAGELRFANAPLRMGARECAQASSWMPILGRTIHPSVR